MDILKVIGVGITGAIIANFIKNGKAEFTVFVTLATGIIILICIMNALGDVILAFNSITDMSGIDDRLFGMILKIIGIGYVTEFAASLCSDMNFNSLSNKIQLAGKVTIFVMALPIITSLIDLIRRIAQ